MNILTFVIISSIKLKIYSKGLSSSKREDCWSKNLFDECLNDNKPRGINDKFYEWCSIDGCTWVFVKRTGITQVDKLKATHINKCIISIQQWKNEFIIS